MQNKRVILMPVVEIIARKALARNPAIGLELIDMIILLWVYSNPYDSKRRQMSSIKNVLKMTELMQSPGGTFDGTDDELTQIVLGSLTRLKEKGYLYIQSAGVHFLKGTLTEAGIAMIKKSVNTPVLRRVTAQFGDSP